MFFSRISFKIALWYTVTFLISAILLFALTGYLLHSSLKKKDQDLLEVKFNEYATLFSRDGVRGLQIQTSGKKIPDASRFLVRYETESGETLFIHIPEKMEVAQVAGSVQKIDLQLKKDKISSWITVEGSEYGDHVEVLSRRLSSGGYLQVGKDTEDREEFLESFARSFAIGLLLVMAIATFIGVALSARVLSPIRLLTQTIEKIRSGQSGSRVPLKGNKDELDRLSALFNQMQDHNERLVQGMKETVDHVAHDIRTPLTRVQMAAESALQKTIPSETDSPLYRAVLESQENVETILTMFNAIMAISEAESGTMSLKMESVNISRLIESVFDLYDLIAEEKKIELKAECAKDLFVTADRGRILQMLANLLDNSIKYSPENSTVTISAKSSANGILIEVQDQGPGIKDTEIPKIWSRLYRGDSSRSTTGLGLGLTLVQAVAKAHKGTVEVQNNALGGATFLLSIPNIT